jgi:hypothetical protein
LKPSRYGVGVFAIRDIPAGAEIFSGDSNEMRDIDQRDIENCDRAIKKMYEDFCVYKGGKWKGPTHLNNLTIGWYLNHSEVPNLRCDGEYNFFAIRQINDDEELTVDYTTYDDRPPPVAEIGEPASAA